MGGALERKQAKTPTGWTDYYLWQYTSEGRLNGYNGNLDCNRRGTVRPVEPPEPSTPYKAKVYSWATPCVNVRNKPSTSGTVVGKNYPNDIVDVVRNDGEWLALLNGYSMSKYYESISEPIIPDPIEPEPEEPVIP